MRSEPPIGDELARLLESMKTTVLERTADEPAAASRGPIAKRVTGIVLGIAALLGLGAGAAFAFGVLPGGGPAPSAPPEPPAATAPRPTTSVPPIEYEVTPGPPPGRVQPASAYAIGCADLASPEVIAGLFADPVEAVDPLVEASGIGMSVPRITAALSAGGLGCSWSNGIAINDQYGDTPGYRGLKLLFMPKPSDGWSERATRYAQPWTSDFCDGERCGASGEVNGSWFEIEAQGADPSGWALVLAHIRDAVVNAPAPAPPTRSAAGIHSICATLPDAGTIGAIAGLDGLTAGGPEGGGWSLQAEAMLIAGRGTCGWQNSEGRIVASAEMVGDGRWAYERMILAGRSEPMTIPGIAPGDEATLRCDDRFGDGCAVDLAIGDDWLNVYGRDRATAIAVAEAVVAHGVR